MRTVVLEGLRPADPVTMTDLPVPVRACLDAVNGHDDPAAARVFTADAVVHDMGDAQTVTGPGAIAEWFRTQLVAAAVRLEPVGITEDGELVVAVDGTFREAPRRASLRFTLAGDRISVLRVRPLG